MNQIIVLGNILDETNTFCSNGRVYDGGGIAPSIGASNFGHERYVLEIKKIGIICNFAMDGSKNFGLKPNGGGISKTLKASTHDIAILERVWKSKK
jgi:hypothetical protein